jgi:hypothetical protein
MCLLKQESFIDNNATMSMKKTSDPVAAAAAAAAGGGGGGEPKKHLTLAEATAAAPSSSSSSSFSSTTTDMMDVDDVDDFKDIYVPLKDEGSPSSSRQGGTASWLYKTELPIHQWWKDDEDGDDDDDDDDEGVVRQNHHHERPRSQTTRRQRRRRRRGPSPKERNELLLDNLDSLMVSLNNRDRTRYQRSHDQDQDNIINNKSTSMVSHGVDPTTMKSIISVVETATAFETKHHRAKSSASIAPVGNKVEEYDDCRHRCTIIHAPLSISEKLAVNIFS